MESPIVPQAFSSTPTWEQEERDGTLAVHLHGDLDGSQDLVRELPQEAAKRGLRRLVLDFSGVHYLSSTGIALLVATLSRCRRAAIELGLCGLRPDCQTIFEMTRLNQIFRIYPDWEAAQSSEPAQRE
jgi:anti-anti-sigma factor